MNSTNLPPPLPSCTGRIWSDSLGSPRVAPGVSLPSPKLANPPEVGSTQISPDRPFPPGNHRKKQPGSTWIRLDRPEPPHVAAGVSLPSLEVADPPEVGCTWVRLDRPSETTANNCKPSPTIANNLDPPGSAVPHPAPGSGFQLAFPSASSVAHLSPSPNPL